MIQEQRKCVKCGWNITVQDAADLDWACEKRKAEIQKRGHFFTAVCEPSDVDDDVMVQITHDREWWQSVCKCLDFVEELQRRMKLHPPDCLSQLRSFILNELGEGLNL